MEFKVLQNSISEDQDIFPITIQSYEDLSIKLIDERKKLSSEVWKYYGLLFNGDSVANPHRYYCSLCLKDLHKSVNNGFKATFSSVHNVSITTATGNLKMHLFKGHNINTFSDSVKDRFDVSLVNKDKRICINVDGRLLEASGDVHNDTNVSYVTNNNSFVTNGGSSVTDDAQSLITSYNQLKESIEKQILSFNSLTILSEILFNPIISTYYLKFSVTFVDVKWDINNLILCYAPLQSVTNESLQMCYDSVMDKFHIQKLNHSRIHLVCTKLVSQIPCISSQELCVVFLTNKLISKEGLYSSVIFRNVLTKCLNIISSLNSSYFMEERLLEEYSDFLQELAEVYFITKFDEQNPLLNYRTQNELSETMCELKYVIRTSVALYLFKFILKNIFPIAKCLKSIRSSHLCLHDSDINCITYVVKFLELFEDLPDIFNNCNNTLIVVPVLKNKMKEFCEMFSGEDSVVAGIKSSILDHLDEYYPMTYLVKMACILDPSVRDILDKDDAYQLLLNRLKSCINDGEEKNMMTLEVEKAVVDDKEVANGLASKKLKLFESLKPQYHAPEYEDKFEKEVRQYLQHVPTMEESETPLLFWKNHAHKYPSLSSLAREHLGIPASCSSSSSIVSLTSLKSQMDLIHANSYRLNSFSYYNNLQFLNH